MKLNNKWKRWIASVLTIALTLTSTGMISSPQAMAATKMVASDYLNATTKYLYVGDKTKGSFDFEIKKGAQKSASSYQWYINKDKGDSNAVAINKKSGLVTAKEAGISYIGCKITLSNGKIIKPEAKVIVRNNITEVGIRNLPKDNQLSAYSEYTLQKEVINTRAGRKKLTQGIVRFELSEDTTSGSKISEDGMVYAAKEGSFKIRAVAFESSKKYKLYLTNKKKYSDYITAVSKWETITVGAPSGLVKVSTQEQLDQVLSRKEVTDITLATDSPIVFTIAKGDYSSKNLVVDAPKSDMNNYGIFKKITVNAIKNSTWIEYSNGNRIYLSDTKLSIVIDGDAEVKEIVFDTPEVNANIVINGKVEKITVLQPVSLNISGATENTKMTVEESAKGCSLSSSVPIDMNTATDINVTLQKGAEGTVLNRSEEGIKVGVDNQTEKAVAIVTNNQLEETIAAGKNTIEKAEPTAKPTTVPKATAKPTPTPKPTPTAKPSPIPTQKPTGTPTSNPTDGTTPPQPPIVVPPTVPSTGDTPTTPITKDTIAPVLTTLSLSADRKVITLTFDEGIVNNLTAAEALKKQVTYTSNNGATINLVTSDSVSINDKKLIITLQNALYLEEVKLSIAADSLKDASGNVIKNIITADVIGNDNTHQTATELTVGAVEHIGGLYPTTDVDWYCFQAKAAQAYRIKASLLDTNVAPKIYLYDADGSTVLEEDITYYKWGDEDASVEYGMKTAGTFYVKVENVDETSTTGGSYGISVTETVGMEGEPNNTPSEANPLSVGQIEKGKWIMPVSDVDFYKFEVKAGETYYIKARGEGDGMSTSLILYAADGFNELKRDSSSMEYTALVSETLYLCVSSKYELYRPDQYDIELNTTESLATNAVLEAENMASNSPYNAQSKLEAAQLLVTKVSNMEIATALQNRLETVQKVIDSAILSALNGSGDNTTLVVMSDKLGVAGFNSLSTEVKSDVMTLFQYQNPQSMGLRGFTSLEEVKVALNKSCVDYNTLLSAVNSASDTVAMKAALNSLAAIYNLSVTELYTSVVLKERATGYSSVTAVMAVKTTVKVDFSTVFYAAYQEYPYYTTGPGGGVLTASVDGVEIHSGDAVDKGKNVVFNFVPDDGNESYNWRFTGVSGTASLATSYTISDVVKDFTLEVLVKKTQVITVSAPTTYSKSDTNDLFIEFTYTNAYLSGVYGSQVWYENNELLASGAATVVDGGISIKKTYLSTLESDKNLRIQICYSLGSKTIDITVTD